MAGATTNDQHQPYTADGRVAEEASSEEAMTMPHAASVTIRPLKMMLRQQAFAFGLMHEAFQMQSRLIDLWRIRTAK
jgi:hypothetical protein